MDNEIGTKYEETKHLDIAEIAKLVRKDINEGKKSGKFPKELKTSVRTSRYAGGQSLRLEVKAVGDMDILSDAAKDHIRETGCLFQLPPHQTYTDEYKELRDALQKIHDSYNFDKSDVMTDYFHVNYYGRVEMDYDLKTQEINKAKIN